MGSKEGAQRPEWMLAPPPSASVAEILRADPRAALKARGFSQAGSQRVQRTSSNGNANGDTHDAGLWTESPDERQKRLLDEEMGVRSRTTDDAVQLDEGEKRKRADERAREDRIRAAVHEHTAARGPSLLEQHQAKRRSELRQRESKGKSREKRSEVSSSDSEEEEERRKRRRRRREEERERERSRSPLSRSQRHEHRRSDDRHERDERQRHHRSNRREGEKDEHRHRRHHHSSSRYSSSSSSKRRSKEEREEADEAESKEKRRKRREKKRKEEEERGKKKGAPMMVWDREAAMSVGGRLMDERKRVDMIKSASSLNDRFGQGSSRYM